MQFYIQDVVREQLNKRQMIDGVSRNMLRFLTSVCGYPEVRLTASQKIEAWLQNPKVGKKMCMLGDISYDLLFVGNFEFYLSNAWQHLS